MLGVEVPIRVGVALKSGVVVAVSVRVGVGRAVTVGDGVSVLVAVSVASGGATVWVTPGRAETHPDSATATRRRDGYFTPRAPST